MAEQLYGISPILDPNDEKCCSDEKSVMTYLAELFKVCPPLAHWLVHDFVTIKSWTKPPKPSRSVFKFLNATKIGCDSIFEVHFSPSVFTQPLQAMPDGISSPATPPSPMRPMRAEAVEINEKEIPRNKSTTMADKLRDLCRFQPKDYFGCAEKVFICIFKRFFCC